MAKWSHARSLQIALSLACGLWLTLFAWNTALWSDDSRLDSVAALLAETRDLGGSLLAPSRLEKAETSLQVARRLAGEERQKPVPLRLFVGAERHLTSARRHARGLQDLSRTVFSNAHDGAEKRLSTAQRAVERVVDLQGKVPRGRDTQLELVQMRRDVQRLAGALTHAELAFDGGEPILAGSLARQVEREARQLATLIDLSMAHR